MSQADFTGIDLKIDRAKEHLGTLNVAIHDFFEGDPYRTVPEPEPDHWFVQRLQRVPPFYSP